MSKSFEDVFYKMVLAFMHQHLEAMKVETTEHRDTIRADGGSVLNACPECRRLFRQEKCMNCK